MANALAAGGRAAEQSQHNDYASSPSLTAYRVYQLDIIMANELANMGRWIYPGQELLIRAAG